jgi:hypothetical protein
MQDDLKITDLRSFAAAVRSGSITRGATALGLSQPVVSQRIPEHERARGASGPAAGTGIGALLPANVPPACRCPRTGNSLPPAHITAASQASGRPLGPHA